ncbi:NADH dehydrogenase (quinone) subunit D [Holophaga foetida]|uniref:NADH dehydrogenase (quinone) subunit D n=1 Tax=Holophaga foetida TaxID=35839 RepID=UPI0002472187|nr:NADH dehydrogenase (quinone) subunit D [Holophaga foetida]
MERTAPTLERLDDHRMIVNLGPSHPSTHGTLRIVLELEGEYVLSATPEIGYLHRGVEKLGESLSYAQFVPLTDRLNYCSSLMNNVGYAQAVEKLLDLKIPPRAELIRVLVSELARIGDHIVCVGINAVDIGAYTAFLYLFKERETLYDLFEMAAGQRMHTSFTRIGGLFRDLPEPFLPLLDQFLESMPRSIDEMERLLTRNPIWVDRTKGVGRISAEQAIGWGYTGPCLRSAGVAQDLRKAQPYLGYETFDFDIPIGTCGDVYDRYLVRTEEMRQSLRIVEQCARRLREVSGPIIVDDYKVALPPKEKVYTRMESLIHHFKLVMHGIDMPVGEVYSATEAANGELGFYLVSDGAKSPYRIHVRPPCFPIFSSLNEQVKGRLIADVIAILGSMNVIAGELDR